MDFVTFDIAKKLKEKGFWLACIGHYEGERFEYNTYDGHDIDISYIARSYNDDSQFNEYTDVPVICQVLKWLREETKINVNMRLYKENGWYYTIQNYRGEPLYSQLTNTDELYPSYEEAALVGIEYVINNLI